MVNPIGIFTLPALQVQVDIVVSLLSPNLICQSYSTSIPIFVPNRDNRTILSGGELGGKEGPDFSGHYMLNTRHYCLPPWHQTTLIYHPVKLNLKLRRHILLVDFRLCLNDPGRILRLGVIWRVRESAVKVDIFIFLDLVGWLVVDGHLCIS